MHGITTEKMPATWYGATKLSRAAITFFLARARESTAKGLLL